ncbi:tail assembly protein [Salmonella phage SE4]|uniref:structural protein with Ig domain n=1 Tax=Salmonella phage SE4 TaxID=2575328 RepID=UPI0011D2E406|nr:structural protein with Ig domain [Salmonella phage SE4]QEG07776.1 tail assembly protein [Salmonella phage SE4]
MANRTTANRPIEDADLRQESVTQFPPAKPTKLDENGKFIPTPVTGITVTPDTASIVVGDFKTLAGVIAPADADDVTILWSSDDETIATVDGSGRVQGIKAGSATITAKSKLDTSKTDTAAITVTNPPVAVTGVTIAPKTASVEVGATQQLTPTVAPSGATNKAVTYTSSDATVATVNSAGLVTGVKAGSATITVKTTDGNFTDTAAITVTAASGG